MFSARCYQPAFISPIFKTLSSDAGLDLSDCGRQQARAALDPGDDDGGGAAGVLHDLGGALPEEEVAEELVFGAEDEEVVVAGAGLLEDGLAGRAAGADAGVELDAVLGGGRAECGAELTLELVAARRGDVVRVAVFGGGQAAGVEPHLVGDVEERDLGPGSAGVSERELGGVAGEEAAVDRDKEVLEADVVVV